MSNTFTDCNGREWPLRITVPDLPFLRERGLELNKPTEVIALIDRLMLDEPEKLVEILYRLGRTKAAELGPEEFAAGFDGPALWRAACSLSCGVIDFFPIPSVAAKLRAALTETINQTILAPVSPISNDAAGRPPGLPESTLAAADPMVADSLSAS